MHKSVFISAFAALLVTKCSGATVIDLATPGNAGDWRITAAGAVDAASFQNDVTYPGRPGSISILDGNTLARFNNFVAGASRENYNGFWYAENSFDLPLLATDVRLDFSGLFGNDRVVLSLNGLPIGNATVGGGTGVGVMRFVESGSDLPYTFTGATSGTVLGGFVIGGTNTLRLTVNNTGSGFTSPTVPYAFDTDGTVATLQTANLSFNATAVPEPSSAALLSFAVLGTSTYLRRVKAKNRTGGQKKGVRIGHTG